MCERCVELEKQLADAWREREIWARASDGYAKAMLNDEEEIKRVQERADRAEAEVKRLTQLLHHPANDPQDERAILKEMRQLWAVREAAEEICVQWQNMTISSSYSTGIEAIKNLNRALGACTAKDPAR